MIKSSGDLAERFSRKLLADLLTYMSMIQPEFYMQLVCFLGWYCRE